jgi:predicted transcriptional regulator of viral defense system
MNNKTISFQSARLLNHLNQQNKIFFKIQDAQAILTESKKGTIIELISSMISRKLLMRIKDGLYHVIPYERDSNSYFPNWHLTAQAMVKPKQYYIGFYSALDLHGLITQPSRIEQIVLLERMLPKRQKVGEVTFDFISFNENHFFGFKNQWIDDFHKVSFSDLEKTLIDCLFIPRYAGGITEISKSLFKSRQQISTEKLYTYLEQFKVQTVNKRLGFLLQHLDLFTDFRKELAKTIKDGYSPLEPSLPKNGRYHSTWKILDNLNIISVIQSLKT